jgi:plastocyanin
MQPAIDANRSLRFLLALGLAGSTIGCSAPGASQAPSAAAAATPPPSASPVAAATPMPTPTITSPVPPTPAASAAAGMLPSTTIPANEPPTDSIQVEMFGPPPQFRPNHLTGTAGESVTFYLVNNSPAREEHGGHDLAIGKKIGAPLVVSSEVKGGGRAVFTVHGLKPGTYMIWCTLYGHADLGQVGTLTLK